MTSRRCDLAVSLVFVVVGFLAACSKPVQPLVVSMSPDAAAFHWELYGKTFDPQQAGVVWHMEVVERREDGKPIRTLGKVTLDQPDHRYDVAALFTYDAKGCKHIKLTLSGGSLTETLTAEATRP